MSSLDSTAAFRLTARYFLLLRQKKVSKEKATPTAPVATRLPCDARRNGPPRNSLTQLWLRSLRHPRRTSPVPSALLGEPNGDPEKLTTPDLGAWNQPERKRSTGAASTGSPLGPPRSAGGTGAVRRGCLSEAGRLAGFTSSAAARSGEHRRVVVRSTTGTSGVAFFWLLFLAKQEK